MLSAELLSKDVRLDTVVEDVFVDELEVEFSFMLLFEMTAAAIAAPRAAHLLASLHLAGSKVLIKTDKADCDELEFDVRLFMVTD